MFSKNNGLPDFDAVIGLLQRVSRAQVTVQGEVIARIGRGLLVLVGVEKGDDAHAAQKLAHRLLNYRVFADAHGRMNLSLLDVGGQMLLVPQFTLAADTRKGMRPGFSAAATPAAGREGFDALCAAMRRQGAESGVALAEGWLQTGRFGADMAVELVNDGPVTFYLRAG